MTPDERLLCVVGALSELAHNWWMRPLRRRLQLAVHEIAKAAGETARMRRALDELADDAREQEQIAMRIAEQEPKRIDVVAVHRAVNAELEAIVSGWRRP